MLGYIGEITNNKNIGSSQLNGTGFGQTLPTYDNLRKMAFRYLLKINENNLRDLFFHETFYLGVLDFYIIYCN